MAGDDEEDDVITCDTGGGAQGGAKNTNDANWGKIKRV